MLHSYYMIDDEGVVRGIAQVGHQLDRPDYIYVDTPFETDLGTKYYDGTQFLDLPEQPSEVYDWKLSERAWVPNFERLVDSLLREVGRMFLQSKDSPLTVEGVSVDGDETAQTNVKSKLEEVRLRRELGLTEQTSLVWKGADNAIHTWGDLDSYYAWLSKYAVSLSARGTQAYQSWWQHKAAIQALADAGDVDALLAYDVTVGWP